MNETMISNWNKTVTNEDVVYHLGDFSFGEPNFFVNRLNGAEIHLILGNHDKKKYDYSGFTSTQLSKILKVGEINIKLIHHPPDFTSERVPFCIHGHVHNSRRNTGGSRTFNASVEVIDYKPILLEDILKGIIYYGH